ncbi:MAG: hypothetical protein FJY85_24710, partial [Deltaproteobacteria bacterium]|nr:hypothetical protein [Deltaproteobacteria bacterium]
TVHTSSLTQEQVDQNRFAVRGVLTDTALTDSSSVIRASRSKEVKQAWAVDTVSNGGEIILESIEQREESPPKNIVMVIDGSSSMRDFVPKIVEGLKSLPRSIPCRVLLASERPVWIDTSEGWDFGCHQDLERLLTSHPLVGGQDNVAALALAWDVAPPRTESVILWIHGPQPVRLSSPDLLRQRWERRPGNPLLYAVQVIPGPNKVLEELDGVQSVRRVPRLGNLEEDLARLFTRWKPESPGIEWKRVRLSAGHTFDRDSAKKTSGHLVRLWANDEVLQLRSIRKADAQGEAITLATRYHLVTPVTGAVVLERAQQYSEAGLTPVAPDKVPTIPEPETWLLLGVISLLLL